MAALIFAALPGAAQQPLTQIGQLQRLTPQEAKRGYPVRLRGVVTYFRYSSDDLFLQDGTGALYVSLPRESSLVPGQLVEVEGISGATGFSLQVREAKIRVVGTAELPRPRNVSAVDLASGAMDRWRVETQGVVRSAALYDSGLMLDIADGPVRFKAFVPPVNAVPEKLLDATVRVRGTSGGIYNSKAQFMGVQLLIPNLAGIEVIETAQQDVFPCSRGQSRRSFKRGSVVSSRGACG